MIRFALRPLLEVVVRACNSIRPTVDKGHWTVCRAQRILGIAPTQLHQRVRVMLVSKNEVGRLRSCHAGL